MGAAPRLVAALPARAVRLVSSGRAHRLPPCASGVAALSDLALPFLALLLLALFGLAVAGGVAVGWPRSGAEMAINGGCASVCAAIGVTAGIYLLAGAPALSLALPIGLPGVGATLALDALSAVFLLLMAISGTAASTYAMAPHGAEQTRALPFFPAFLAGMTLTLLAADGWTLLFGFELMSLASWGLVLARHEEAASRGAALLYLGIAVLGVVCLAPMFALLAPSGAFGNLSFAAMRAAPPEGWRAAAILVLALVGAGSKAGLAPLHPWLPLAHPAAPSHASAVMSGAMTKVALYVLIRVLFDLSGPAQPLWWSLPLLAMGAASAVLGGLRANLEADLKSVLAASTIENVGLIAIGLGLAMAAHAADLPGLAALALGAALLHALNHGVFKTLLFLAAGSAQHGAGSRVLSRLGGLIHRMPVTTACVLVGGAALAGLPPASGFASEWLLFQSAFGALRIGGLGVQTIIAVIVLLMAMAAALAAAAAVRLVGVAFLGRPRTPRAAAAEESSLPVRAALIGLSALTVFLGLFPGAALRLLEPALHQILGARLEGRGALVVAPQADMPGYAPIGILLLLAVLAAAAVWVGRRFGVAGQLRGPAWDCGFAPPPAWLPFGDPATQYGAASFGQPIRRALATALLTALPVLDMPAPGETRAGRLTVTMTDPALRFLFAPVDRIRDRISGVADRMQFLTIRRTLSVMFAALVLFLIAVAWVQAL